MWDQLFKFLLTVAGALGIDTDGRPYVGTGSNTFTVANTAATVKIQLPSNGKGWKVIGLFSSATAVDFTADISRSKSSEHLTGGQVPSELCLPDPSNTYGKSLIPPFEADDNESIDFSLVNGATAANVVRLAVIARRK